jgi:thiol:disulfide interchange protein DsbA
MKHKKIFFILILSAALFIPFNVKGDNPIQGRYIELPGHQFNFDGKTVEIIEFMSFYCKHCYSLERHTPIIKGNLPGRIRWRTIPVYWGSGSSKPGEAYLLAEESGKGEEMKGSIFHARFVERRDIGNIEVLERLASSIGLGFGFSRKLRAGEKAKAAQEALDMADAYGLQATPTLVIAGNIMTNPKMAGPDMGTFAKNVIVIVRSIFKKQ